MRNTGVVVFWGLMLLPFTSFGDEPGAQSSLAHYYQLALENNPTINSYKSQLAAAEARQQQNRASLFPQVNANASYSYGNSETQYSGSSTFTNSNNTSDSRSASISLRQALFHKSDFAALDQQTVYLNLAKASLQASEQQLMQTLSENYFNVMASYQNLLVAKAQSNALEKHLERANMGFKLGVIGINDKLEAQARYDIAIADQLNAENKLLIDRKTLEVLINTSFADSNVHTLNNQTVLPPIETSLAEWESLAQQNNFSIIVADYAREIEQYEVTIAQGQRFPILDLVIKASDQAQYSSFARANSDTFSTAASLELSVPIFTSGLLSARVAEARSKRDQKEAELEDIKRNILLNVRSEFLTASSLKKQVDALRSAQRSSQNALDAAQKGLEVGTRTNLDVLDAQKQLYDVERSLATAQYQYLVSQIKLKNLAGILKLGDIESLDKLLAAS